MVKLLLCFPMFFLCSSFGSTGSIDTLPIAKQHKVFKAKVLPKPNIKVAFLGDSDDGEGFREALRLIKREKAELTVHLGDLSYNILPRAPLEWNKQINQILGENYPYVSPIGNHDKIHWHPTYPGYISLFKERLAKTTKELSCYVKSNDWDFGVKSYCDYKGLLFLLSGIGTRAINHEPFIEETLKKYPDESWKICAWHKNQRSLQVGLKGDEVGWPAYRICSENGALIATGHEHSYSRTKTLTKVSDIKNNHGTLEPFDKVELGADKTFVFVNGLGGKSVRHYNCTLGPLAKWWASIYTSTYIVKNGEIIKPSKCKGGSSQNKMPVAQSGVLFITFNYQGNTRKAKAQFITNDNKILDEFTIDKQ